MAAPLNWDNVTEIGIALADRFRDLNPLELQFTDIHRYVTELPGFRDDPKASNDAKLQAIQQAWHEEWEDRTR